MRKFVQILLGTLLVGSSLVTVVAPASAGCLVAAYFTNDSDEWLVVRDWGDCEGQGEYQWMSPGEQSTDDLGWGWDSDYYLDNNKNLLNHSGVVKGPWGETKQGAWNYECEDHNMVVNGSFVATKCFRDWWY